MPSYITQCGSFLPGKPVENARIHDYLGLLDGETEIEQRVLAMNGIVRRHYAQDTEQRATHDVYDLATEAVRECIAGRPLQNQITFLSAGTTYAPLSGPGFGSILHHRLKQAGLVDSPLEISSHAGICSSAAAAFVAASRSVQLGEHRSALCVGAEHASEVLKSSVIQPVDDRALHRDVRHSQWFMSVFLRFMLSDGAGAFLIESTPRSIGLSLHIDWTHSMSFANETPLCMKLDNASHLLTQDISILSRFLFPSAAKFVAAAMQKYREDLDSYRMILPHMSSFFFRRKLERMICELSDDRDHPVPYWTNLATAGNTGAASIYVMLDDYLKQYPPAQGDRILLFVPESGQFNFVMASLTAVIR